MGNNLRNQAWNPSGITLAIFGIEGKTQKEKETLIMSGSLLYMPFLETFLNW